MMGVGVSLASRKQSKIKVKRELNRTELNDYRLPWEKQIKNNEKQLTETDRKYGIPCCLMFLLWYLYIMYIAYLSIVDTYVVYVKHRAFRN